MTERNTTELPGQRALSTYLIERRRANSTDQEDWLGGIEAGVWSSLDLFEEALAPAGAGLGTLRLAFTGAVSSTATFVMAFCRS